MSARRASRNMTLPRRSRSTSNTNQNDIMIEIPRPTSANNEPAENHINLDNITLDSFEFINIQHETNFRLKLKIFLNDILIYQCFSLLISVVILLTFQLQVASLKDGLNAFRISVGLHLILCLRSYSRHKNKVEKRKHMYQVIKDGLYLLLLISYNAEEIPSTFAILALVVAILVTYLLSTWGLYMAYKESYHRVVQKLNKKFLHMRMIYWLQLIAVSLKLLIPNNFSWRIVLIPLYCLIVYHILLFGWLLEIVYSDLGRVFFSPKSKEPRLKPMLTVLGFLLAFIGLECWGIIFFAFDLDFPGVNNSVGLLCAIIGFNISLIIYINKYQQDIFTISKSLGAIFEYTPDQISHIKQLFDRKKNVSKPMEESKAKSIPKKRCFRLKPNNKIPDKVSKPLEKYEVETNDGKCMICFEAKSSSIFDCGHGGICFPCGIAIAESKKECHMCRQKISILYELQQPELSSQIFKVLLEKKI